MRLTRETLMASSSNSSSRNFKISRRAFLGQGLPPTRPTLKSKAIGSLILANWSQTTSDRMDFEEDRTIFCSLQRSSLAPEVFFPNRNNQIIFHFSAGHQHNATSSAALEIATAPQTRPQTMTENDGRDPKALQAAPHTVQLKPQAHTHVH